MKEREREVLRDFPLNGKKEYKSAAEKRRTHTHTRARAKESDPRRTSPIYFTTGVS